MAAASAQLPDGAGRQILNRACVTCHALTEVTKFRGFYARAQWRDIVLTMVDYGAPVGEKDVEVLTDYLTAQPRQEVGRVPRATEVTRADPPSVSEEPP